MNFSTVLDWFPCLLFAAFPFGSYLIAKYRGVNPLLGAALGLLGCIGWIIVFLIAPAKGREAFGHAGRSYSVDENFHLGDDK